MIQNLKFDRNRKRVKYCPCGKSNRNQKFVPFEGYEQYGYCHSCDKTFLEKSHSKLYTPYYPLSPAESRPKVSFHNKSLVIKYGRSFSKNNFVQFLTKHFDKGVVKNVILKYCIGTPEYWKGDTLFWQIDERSNIRHGKVMLYDKSTGKRIKKNGRSYINSIRSIAKLKDFHLEQCLFGLHLVNEYQGKSIAIVEGEKTAILMSIFKPQYLWLATGSKQGFKESMLTPIKNHSVVAFPDKGEYADWKNTADTLNQQGFRIMVNDWLENLPAYRNGTDLADVLLQMGLKGYAKEGNDTPIQQIIPTTTEIQIKKLATKNQSILTLIKEFDLRDQYGAKIRFLVVNPKHHQHSKGAE